LDALGALLSHFANEYHAEPINGVVGKNLNLLHTVIEDIRTHIGDAFRRYAKAATEDR
jgi:hypothetical protein